MWNSNKTKSAGAQIEMPIKTWLNSLIQAIFQATGLTSPRIR